ncbi:hypothetical protein JYB54_001971, partial [Salmonella enterica]|nr:hypothetical protein [Salmonella enterica]EGJ9847876.1 hypothetical protein [Salmonella enterica]EHB3457158.1 hypothetical protein [Salmonella enterica]EHE9140214.1 hypothetical protein [Salmonella enterica]EHM5288546.1 hypothetical protein [Salmonella enterica]
MAELLNLVCRIPDTMEAAGINSVFWVKLFCQFSYTITPGLFVCFGCVTVIPIIYSLFELLNGTEEATRSDPKLFAGPGCKNGTAGVTTVLAVCDIADAFCIKIKRIAGEMIRQRGDAGAA